MEHGWTLYGILNVLFLVVGALAVVMTVIKSRLFKRRTSFVLFLLCIIAIPFFCCIWHFVSSQVSYRPMMLQSVCVIYIFIAIVASSEFCIGFTKPIIFLLALIIFNYGIQANICYFLLDRSYEATYATGIEMISRIHLIDDDIEDVAFVGDIAGDVCWDTTGYGTKAHLLSSCLEQNLLFNQDHAIRFLNNTFNCNYSSVSVEQLKELEQSDAVKQMGNWPETDSMKMLGSTLVIKLSDPQSSEIQN